jgi:hypothetical protein
MSTTFTTDSKQRTQLVNSIVPGSSNLVVVTGAGVSLQAAGYPDQPNAAVAGWTGLLADGVEYCRRYNLIDTEYPDIVKQQIDSGETDNLIAAAQTIRGWFNRGINRREHWISESIGCLKVRDDDELIPAIQKLGGLIATLNYDDLLQQVTKLPTVHWKDQQIIDKYLMSGTYDFIFHIHGHWKALESIVLDQTSYDEFHRDENMNLVMKRFARWHCMVFIGCLGTFTDPNFERLIEWCGTALEGSLHRHFVLCSKEEEGKFLELCGPYGFLEPVVYGENHSDLTPFIEFLAKELRAREKPDTSISPPSIESTKYVQKATDVWKTLLQQ